MGTPQIDALWREIESIPPPEPIFLVSTDGLGLTANSTPSGLEAKAAPIGFWIAWGAILGATVGLAVQGPHLVWLALLPAAGVAAMQIVRGRPGRSELRRRSAILTEARRSHAALVAEVNSAGPVGFAELQNRLGRMRQECVTEVASRQQRALAAFDTQARSRQLQRYLETSSILDAPVTGLGPGRKATLVQHGITHAAQVSPDLIATLPGFGPVLTSAVLAWRESRVRAFRYNPRDPLTARERDGVIAPFDARRHEIRLELRRGRDKLRRMCTMPAEDRLDLARRLAAASEAVEQAELDVRALKRTCPLGLPRGGYRRPLSSA